VIASRVGSEDRVSPFRIGIVEQRREAASGVGG
jgi:hypothetical protein